MEKTYALQLAYCLETDADRLWFVFPVSIPWTCKHGLLLLYSFLLIRPCCARVRVRLFS